MGAPILVPMFAVTGRPVGLHGALLLLLAVVLNSLAPENERLSTAAKVIAEDMEGRAAIPCVPPVCAGGNSQRFDRFAAWIAWGSLPWGVIGWGVR